MTLSEIKSLYISHGNLDANSPNLSLLKRDTQQSTLTININSITARL